jgi:hypothetical protein
MTTTTGQVYGESVELGDEIGPLMKSPGLAEVQAFLNVSPSEGKDHGRFLDAEAAKLVGFESPIVPGSMTQAYLSQLLTDWSAPAGRVLYINVNFRRPANHNDVLRCIGLVTDTREEGDSTVVRLDVFAENDRGERPVQGTAEVVIPTRA